MASERVSIAPDVVRWARTTAGLSSEATAKRLGVGVEVVEKWESGEADPTIKQLRKAANLYKRPLAVLLLSEPPDDYQAMRDFRRLSAASQDLSPELRTEVRRAATQREVFLELREVAPELLPQSVDLPELTLETDTEIAATSIRDLLAVSRPPRSATQHDHLNAWVAAVEALGVIVIHTRRVAIQDARGFSLSEWPYPVVAINGSEFARPRLFTLLHEVAHLALNTGGLCDQHEVPNRTSMSDNIEHYCNQVAAAILMPAPEILALPGIASASEETLWNADELRDLAGPFGASAEAFLLRLITLGRASWTSYWNIKGELEAGYEQARKREKERQKETEGGPSYYVVKARDFGHGYVSSVLDAFGSRAITSSDVAHYLDVRYDQLPKLQAALR